MSDDAIRRVQSIIDQSEALLQKHRPDEMGPHAGELAGLSMAEALEVMFVGSVFISHSALDLTAIVRHLIPSVEKSVGNRYFLFNMREYGLSGGAVRFEREHAVWVNRALRSCKTVLVVASAYSAESEWVKWECFTAAEQGHPIIICCLDSTNLSAFNIVASGRPSDSAVTKSFAEFNAQNVCIIDFNTRRRVAGRQLCRLLTSPNFAPSDWNGRPMGAVRFMSGMDSLQRVGMRVSFLRRIAALPNALSRDGVSNVVRFRAAARRLNAIKTRIHRGEITAKEQLRELRNELLEASVRYDRIQAHGGNAVMEKVAIERCIKIVTAANSDNECAKAGRLVAGILETDVIARLWS